MSNKKCSKQDCELLHKKLSATSTSKLMANLSSNDTTLKYTTCKVLIHRSETEPQKVYSQFKEFVNLIDSKNNILKWTALIVIGNLAPVDKDKKIDKILPKLFAQLNTGKMITAGNTAKALGIIAKNKPEFVDKITNELLKVERYKYDTEECNRIACAHVIDTFSVYLSKPNKKVLEFLSRQSKSTRASVVKRARKLLKKFG